MPQSISYGCKLSDDFTNLEPPLIIAFAQLDCQYNQTCNEDLKGLTSLQVLDKVVSAAASRGLYIMFDLHSFEPDAYMENGLW